MKGNIMGDGAVLLTGAPRQGPSNRGSPAMCMGLPEGLPTHRTCIPPLDRLQAWLGRRENPPLFAYLPANDVRNS